MNNITAEKIKEVFAKFPEFKYIHFDETKLGNDESMYVYLSFQSKEDWNYKIFHNSPYLIIKIEYLEDVKYMEVSSKNFSGKTFRKSRFDSIEKVEKILKKWVELAMQ